MVMCYDTSVSCVDGWQEINIDTSYYTSRIIKNSDDRIEIVFGNSLIGISDTGDTINQTIIPTITQSGQLFLSEFPIGGHNNFVGEFIRYDSLYICIQFGYNVGGYDKYRILGIKEE